MLLAVLAAALAIGIAASIPHAGGVVPVVPLLVAAGASLAWGRRFAVASAVWAVGAGLALGWAAQRPRELGPAVQAAVSTGVPASIGARVIRGPEQTRSGRVRVLLELEWVDDRPASGGLALVVVEGRPEVAPGDHVRFWARLRTPPALANPHLPDPIWRLRAEGIDLISALDRAEDIRQVGVDRWMPARMAFRARNAMRRVIDGAVGGEVGAFLRAQVLGERSVVGPRVEAGFRAAGATHLLSVSGLHLAVVTSLVFLAMKRALGAIPSLSLRFDAGALAAALSLPPVAFYTALTGGAVATQRAAVMAGIVLGARIVGRAPAAPATIGAAVIALLVWSPLSLVDPSFQLSFASVVGLSLVARFPGPSLRDAQKNGKGRRLFRRAVEWAGRLLATTGAAALTTSPLVAHHFGELAPAAPLGNLVLVPIVELGVVPTGLAGAVLGLVWPAGGAALLWVSALAARASLAVADVFRATAPVWLVRYPDLLETGLLTAASVMALLGLRPPTRAHWRRWLAGAVAGVVLATLSISVREAARRLSRDMRVTFLDVGQGDAAVVEQPGGRVVLVDGGGTFDGAFDPGERVVEPFLRARGISGLDVVALSHPHPDHLNGLLRILDRFEVRVVWTSGTDGNNPDYHRFLASAARLGVPVRAPVPTRLGEVAWWPLGPFVGDQIAAPAGVGVNDASLVLRAAYAGRSVLFTGDIEEDGEAELVGRGAAGLPLEADVLKVPHHGSRTSSGEELIDAVMPRIAVLSLGASNRFRLPHPEVLARYRARGVRLLRTDRHGAITVTVGAGGEMGVACVRPCP